MEKNIGCRVGTTHNENFTVPVALEIASVTAQPGGRFTLAFVAGGGAPAGQTVNSRRS